MEPGIIGMQEIFDWFYASFPTIRACWHIARLLFGIRSIEARITKAEDKLQELTNHLDGTDKQLADQKASTDYLRPFPYKYCDIVYHNNLLWVRNHPHPYCSACYEKEKKAIHMLRKSENSEVRADGAYYVCPGCQSYMLVTPAPDFPAD